MNIKKLRLVIDTNVLISGLVFGGKPGQIIKLLANDKIQLVISEELLSELRRKIHQRFPLYVSNLELLEASLRKDAEMVQLGEHNINVSRDPNDNMFIETAFIGGCENIISGDKDLLDVGEYMGIRIISPAQFLDEWLLRKN